MIWRVLYYVVVFNTPKQTAFMVSSIKESCDIALQIWSIAFCILLRLHGRDREYNISFESYLSLRVSYFFNSFFGLES